MAINDFLSTAKSSKWMVLTRASYFGMFRGKTFSDLVWLAGEDDIELEALRPHKDSLYVVAPSHANFHQIKGDLIKQDIEETQKEETRIQLSKEGQSSGKKGKGPLKTDKTVVPRSAEKTVAAPEAGPAGPPKKDSSMPPILAQREDTTMSADPASQLDTWTIRVRGQSIPFGQAFAQLFDAIDNQTTKLDTLETNVNKLEKSLSDTSEKGSGTALAALYQFLEPNAKVMLPITGKLLPYPEPTTSSAEALERLVALCLKRNWQVRNVPEQAEVDAFLKIKKNGTRFFSPKMLRKTAFRLSTKDPVDFTHLVLGETTRSPYLFNDASTFIYPARAIRNPSSKLLFKLCQLERGIIAARSVYQGGTVPIDGVAVISPSFKVLDDPDALLKKIFENRNAMYALPNLAALWSSKKVWLVDL